MSEELKDKVIKGLEYCIDYEQRLKDALKEVPCEECPYRELKPRQVGEHDCIDTLFHDALVLLKAQDDTVCTKERCPVNANSISDDCNVKTCPWRTEAVVPKLIKNKPWFGCPVCGRHLLAYEDHYCSGCGKRVKWDG